MTQRSSRGLPAGSWSGRWIEQPDEATGGFGPALLSYAFGTGILAVAINLEARDPGVGTGKPGRLSGDLAGFWSRRIDQEHRIVYTVHADDLVIVQARYHH